MKCVIVQFVLWVVLVKEGYGLVCFVSECVELNGKMTCDPADEIQICPAGYDRCLTMSTKMTQPGMVMTMEINNCSVALACSHDNKNMACKAVRDNGGTCDIKCCHGDAGDVCNFEFLNETEVMPDPFPTLPAETVDVCYVCKAGYDKSSTSLIGGSCDKPQRMKCEENVDRCAVVKYQRKDPKTAKIRDIELRNCTYSLSCPYICMHLNETGDLVSCNTSCCEGNLCNGDAPKATPLAHSTGGQDSCVLINMVSITVGVLLSMFFE